MGNEYDNAGNRKKLSSPIMEKFFYQIKRILIFYRTVDHRLKKIISVQSISPQKLKDLCPLQKELVFHPSVVSNNYANQILRSLKSHFLPLSRKVRQVKTEIT